MLDKFGITNVVLVEDDADDREFFQEAIDSIPYKINLRIYQNGYDFVKGMIADKENIPDLVFLDLNMPIKNGIQALKELKEVPEFKTIPVIAIYSTSTSDVDQAETLRSGADAFISKPTDYRELKTLISKVFQIDWKNRNIDKKNFVITPL